MLTNAVREHMAELGTVTAQRAHRLTALKEHFRATQAEMPRHAAAALLALSGQTDVLSNHVEKLEAKIFDWHKANDVSRRLTTIPGVGLISAIAASVPDATSAAPHANS